jgi:predicted phosphodiesterase
MGKTTYKGEMARELIAQFPNVSTILLAKMLHDRHPLDFPNLEAARSVVRHHRNEKSDRVVKNAVGERTPEQLKSAQGWAGIPKTDYKECEPFIMPKGNNRILVLSDIHLPYHDEQALQIAIDWAIEKKPNAIILNGDTMDMYQASRYVKDRRLRDLNGEIEMTRDFLKSLRELFDCPVYFKTGNHEVRYENYLKSVAPELLGIADFELRSILRFGELGVTEIKDKQIIKAGNLNIMHGHEFGHSVFSPVNAARGLYMRAKANAIIGHHHQTSEHSEKDLKGDIVTTWSMGCLCGLAPEYYPYNKWNHGFAWVEFKENGDFEVQNKRIINGKVR